MSIIGISPIVIPDRLGLRREPPRPPNNRQPGYAQNFDFDTLIFDVAAIPEDRSAVLISPPGLNLRPLWQAARFTSASGAVLPFVFEDLDRMARVTVRSVDPGEGLTLTFGDVPIALRPVDSADAFAGLTVLMTQSKDNDLAWIADWVEFYARVHGVDAVLLFDNRSSAYRLEAIERTMLSVAGIKAAEVVDWPVLFGPQANKGEGWDSDFGQYGMLELARWRFLRRARLVINADIDELLLPEVGGSLAAACAASQYAAVAYRSLWTVGDPAAPASGAARHRDFDLVEPSDNRLQSTKWSVEPMRAPELRQWKVHRLDGLAMDDIYTNRMEVRHFRSLSTGWKPSRLRAPLAMKPGTFRDERLIEIFREIGWRS